MIVYWVAVIEILIYLSAIPLHIAIFFRAGDGFAVSAGFSLFERRFARRRAINQLGRPKETVPDKPTASLPRKLRLVAYLLKHMEHIAVRVQGSVSLGEAASTALLCGSLQALEYSLRPFLPQLRLNILPDFGSEKPCANVQGMISLRSGQIIYAAISGAAKNASRRITQWISIRLKAS